MLLPAYINVNQSGIPALRSLSVSVGTNDVRFDFNNHRNVGRPFRGLIIFNLAYESYHYYNLRFDFILYDV